MPTRPAAACLLASDFIATACVKHARSSVISVIDVVKLAYVQYVKEMVPDVIRNHNPKKQWYF
jgi:hypothetical protein